MHIAFVRRLLVICLIYMQNATATHVTDDFFSPNSPNVLYMRYLDRYISYFGHIITSGLVVQASRGVDLLRVHILPHARSPYLRTYPTRYSHIPFPLARHKSQKQDIMANPDPVGTSPDGRRILPTKPPSSYDGSLESAGPWLLILHAGSAILRAGLGCITHFVHGASKLMEGAPGRAQMMQYSSIHRSRPPNLAPEFDGCIGERGGGKKLRRRRIINILLVRTAFYCKRKSKYISFSCICIMYYSLVFY